MRLEGADQRAVLALGAQVGIHLPQRRLDGQFLDAAHGVLGEPGRHPHGLVVALGDEDDVHVAEVVQFAGARLAHADDRQRAPIATGRDPGQRQRGVERRAGEVGQRRADPVHDDSAVRLLEVPGRQPQQLAPVRHAQGVPALPPPYRPRRSERAPRATRSGRAGHPAARDAGSGTRPAPPTRRAPAATARRPPRRRAPPRRHPEPSRAARAAAAAPGRGRRRARNSGTTSAGTGASSPPAQPRSLKPRRANSVSVVVVRVIAASPRSRSEGPRGCSRARRPSPARGSRPIRVAC